MLDQATIIIKVFLSNYSFHCRFFRETSNLERKKENLCELKTLLTFRLSVCKWKDNNRSNANVCPIPSRCIQQQYHLSFPSRIYFLCKQEKFMNKESIRNRRITELIRLASIFCTRFDREYRFVWWIRFRTLFIMFMLDSPLIVIDRWESNRSLCS